LDKEDEAQIKAAGEQLKQALVYEITIKGKKVKQITYIGLKWIIVRMSQHQQALQIENSETTLDKDDPDKQEKWYWRSSVSVRNIKTGLQTEGKSECPYLEKIWIYENNQRTEEFNMVYDAFGKIKSHSKAERNAWRKQVPELEIINLLKVAKGEDVKNLDEPNGKTIVFCNCSEGPQTKLDGTCERCKNVSKVWYNNQNK